MDDTGSELLALKVKKLVDDDNIKIFKFGELKESDYTEMSSVFVVAGAITTGRKLLSASRKLRCLNKSSSISYLVGFSKLQNAPSLDQLRKDLCMGGMNLLSSGTVSYLGSVVSQKPIGIWNMKKFPDLQMKTLWIIIITNKKSLPIYSQDYHYSTRQLVQTNCS
ncbi:hypothetical protein [Rouxiella chamberiensis]|uniref:Uncharacterized protein n=1 Tax=Rouxiella chamberiensis TaxID=1513468 RepID=A0ABY7HS98_9GAMM|nr:hypothetical protein [Rouxiella chamberiensis]WAT02093.1 hypothetical protein O1V66_05310 [Rouxiella chamberiensis]